MTDEIDTSEQTEASNGYFRKVIKITARDSPNVRYAEEEIAAGLDPSNRIIIPGVMPWADYQKRLALWDEERISVGLRAEFFEGASSKLYPALWLDRAHRVHESLDQTKRRAVAMGIDPAEGGDNTSFAVVDEQGLFYIESAQTPDTTVVCDRTIDLIRTFNIPSEMACFDRGGGGKQHADRLRRMGYNVSTVSFGEAATGEPQRSIRWFDERYDIYEQGHTYRNRRVQMYGWLRLLLDPANNPQGFGIPAGEQYDRLRYELERFPLIWGTESVMDLPPKRPTPASKNSAVETLVDLIGHSPDESDALVIAVYTMLKTGPSARVGVI